MQIMINRGEEMLRISPKECKRIQFSTNHGRIHGWFVVMVHQILVLSTHCPKSCINEKQPSDIKELISEGCFQMQLQWLACH